MVRTLYKDTNYSLEYLVEDLKRGNIALPDIQRPFVWKPSKARDLLDSMYRGFPVGTLMFWETGIDVGARQIGSGGAERVASRLIVDGQQRLTSLYAVLTGHPVLNKSFETKCIRIAFHPGSETFEVTDAAIEQNPEFIPDITVLWRDGFRSTVRSYFANLAGSRGADLDEDEEEELEERIDRVYDLRNFRFQVIELASSADEQQVAEIFVRINSEGVKLNQADFILTLMSVHWEEGRKELEQFCRAAVSSNGRGPSPRNPFIDPGPDQLLRAAVGVAFRRARLQNVYSILRGKDLETGDFSVTLRDQQFERLRAAQKAVLDLTNWHEFQKCLTHAGFRSRRMLTSENALVFTYILWLIGRLDFGIELRKLRSIMARWFFMVHTTGRYTSSPESQLESDLRRISNLDSSNADAFVEELERIIEANFTRDYWDISFPNRLDSSSARSPALFAYWAALHLLDAELLFSEVRMREVSDPSVVAPRSVERHHLFPKAYLAQQGLTKTSQVNAIANMAFLDWPENMEIGAQNPMSYWPVMRDKLDSGRIDRQAEWHALPVGWEQLDYPSFLEKRRKLIAKVVRKGFEQLSEHAHATTRSDLESVVAAGESQTVEFKSTARWNLRVGQQDKKMEHVIVKTVGGFLNAEGGTLVIGVDDEGQVLGLENDYKTLGSKANRDGYELFLRQHLDNFLSVPTARIVRIRFEQLQGLDVCVVSVAPSARPVFSRALEGGKQPSEFWVRIGNATKQLHGEEMVQYQKDRWEA
ncbi:MAG: DUF262 domain-containing protein [Vulcanimicrobiota bacterium]